MSDSIDRDYDYREIDEVIHGRVRLSIMAYLSGAGSASFAELQQRAQVNEGNLSVHLRKLEEAGYVEIEKRFVGRKPQTLCRLSRSGRDAWIAYIGHMQRLLGGG
ncbi:winged helix-turn-helix domain-containing protein [Sphingosinicella terrae]|uniref:winged helix-turn-helix domain-containing protein n=1 Tax=Sphingosinicella terrae TaxID=2172047 RepID=UPI000E0CD913|nr:transcriptional regulator [Sphingosinicella terrae]